MGSCARRGDSTIGVCSDQSHPGQTFHGTIVGGSSLVTIEGKGAARVGDLVLSDCGHTGIIVTGTTKTTVEGLGMAREGDTFTGVYSGTIVESSHTVEAI